MPTKNLQIWTNNIDTVIASGWDDVLSVMKKHSGKSVSENLNREFWNPLDNDEEIVIFWNAERHGIPEDTISVNQIDDHPDVTHRIAAPASAWRDLVGRGFLCSTEY